MAGTRAWWGDGGVGSLASGPAGRKMAAPERGGLSRVTQAGPLPVPPPMPSPSPDLTPAGNATKATCVTAARAGRPRRPGTREGCCPRCAIRVPVLGSAVRAGGNLRATRTPWGLWACAVLRLWCGALQVFAAAPSGGRRWGPAGLGGPVHRDC